MNYEIEFVLLNNRLNTFRVDLNPILIIDVTYETEESDRQPFDTEVPVTALPWCSSWLFSEQQLERSETELQRGHRRQLRLPESSGENSYRRRVDGRRNRSNTDADCLSVTRKDQSHCNQGCICEKESKEACEVGNVSQLVDAFRLCKAIDQDEGELLRQ